MARSSLVRISISDSDFTLTVMRTTQPHVVPLTIQEMKNGATGPATDGRDYEKGWKFEDAIELEMVDEHGYKTPNWFWDNLQRFNGYPRDRSQVYLGEYVAHDRDRGNTSRPALSEAAYLTAIERNGDHVRLSSYAPLLSKQGRTQWRPDLTYFDNVAITPSIKYYVQRLFSIHGGDQNLPTAVSVEQDSNKKGTYRDSIRLGTWNRQAKFDDARITQGTDVAFNDSFDQLSSDWILNSGQRKVSEGALLQTSDQQPAVIQYGFPADRSRYTLRLRAMKSSEAEGFLVGFAAAANNEYMCWNLGCWGNTMHAIERFGDAGDSIVGSTAQGHLESNRWYDIMIKVSKDRIRCYLDSCLMHDVAHEYMSATLQLAASCVRESPSGDTILKIVSNASHPVSTTIALSSLGSLGDLATNIVLSGDADAEIRHGEPAQVAPVTSTISMFPTQKFEIPANSFTVLRIHAP